MRRRRPGTLVPEMLLRLLSKAATEPYPSKPINRPEGFRGRIAIRDELCIGCHRCFIVCPTTCIEMVDAPREVERKGKTFVRKQKPIVHLLTCIRCGLCEEACPTEPEAIYLMEESSGSYTDEDVIVE